MGKRLEDRDPSPVFRRPSRSGMISPFIGRTEELRRLSSALTLAAEGQGDIIFLTGQPGIGKTRLAQEALALAKQRGFTVMEGRSFPLRAGLAYAPLLDAIGPLLRSLEPARLDTLVDGLPDLGRLFGDLRLSSQFSSDGLGDPALEKTRLFEAVLRLLERLTRDAPVALFIDDVHWADPATLELLHYLAYGLAHQPAMLLATYGPDALGSSRGLRALVRSLLRDELAEELVIPPLEPEAVDQLVRGVLRGEVPDSLLSLLAARAGGTPLFIEAYIAALIDSGNLVCSPSEMDGWIFSAEGMGVLPPSVRRLMMERLEGLAPAERHLLEVIAIMGDATSHIVLRVLLGKDGLEEEVLLDALRCLQAMGLVIERPYGSEVAYSIPHPLIQEAAYSEMPEMARRRAHLAAINALESLSKGRPADANRLARHYRGAGSEANAERALAVLIEAGNRALAVYANDAAAGHYAAALALVREGGGLKVEGGEDSPSTLPPQPSTLPVLLERLGEAWERTGAGLAAIGLWSEAVVERERAGDALAASRLRCRLATAESNRGHFDSAKAHLTAGLTALQRRTGHEPCQELADLHYARFFVFDRLGDVEGMANAAAELLSVAKQLALPRAEADANLVAVSVSLGQGDVNAAREHALHALAVAESFSQGQELATCCYAHGLLVIIGMRLGDHQFTRHHAEHGLAMAQRLGAPSMEVIFHSRLAYVDLTSGAWEDSLHHAMEAVSLARRVGHARDLAFALAGQAVTLALQGELTEAAICISEVRVACGNVGTADRYVLGLVEVAEAILALERGQAEHALEIANGFVRVEGGGLRVEEGDSPPSSRAYLMPPYLPMGLMLLAEAQVAAGEPESALETAQRLRALGPAGNQYLIALAFRAEGLARQAVGEREAAIVCLTQAADMFAGLEMPFEAARSLLELATTALRGTEEHRALAVTSAQRSLGIFVHLSAQRYAERTRQLLQELGIVLLVTRQSRLGGVPVSERELEIARLVTEGMTTREIARRLILSPRTVSRHLERLYTRMGISSRTALARSVIEAGLVRLKKQIG